MKHTIKISIITGLAFVVLLSSCAKKLDDAYENPNAPKRVPVEQLFPSMIGSITGSSSAAGSAYGLAGDALLIGRYIQYWGTFSTTSSAVSQTGANSSNYDQMGGTVGVSDNLGSVWAAHYYGMGQNLNRIIEWGVEEQKWDFVGAAWALRAWSMLESANEYGEIILRQAFDITRQQFTYENQSEVYDSVRVICHRAIAYLNMTGGNMNPAKFATSDAFFNGGDLGRWKKFVYGLLARSYGNLSFKAIYSPDSVIKYASLSCATTADNVTCKFQNTGITGTSNYFGLVRQNINATTTAIRQSAFIADLMSGMDTLVPTAPTRGSAFVGVIDPRRWYIIRENPNGGFKGIVPWLGNSGLALNDRPRNFLGYAYDSLGYPYADQRGRYIFRDESEWPVMTAAEMLLLKAEAEIRKGNKPNALIAYVSAINENFDMLSSKYSIGVPAANLITPASRAAYLANAAAVPALPAGLTLTHVMLQKYIVMYGWGAQVTWADMRRYHYTDFDPGTGAQVYAGFAPPSGANLFSQNLGKLVYRARPRYNSEYLYNIPSLISIGAYPVGNDYHTLQPWFVKP